MRITGSGRADFPEPENEKRQYNISEEDKQRFLKAKADKIKRMKSDQCHLMIR